MNNLDIRDFIDKNYSHFNAGELRNCVQSLDDFLNKGGKLLLTLAGALSTAEIGKTLAPAIRSGLVHAISCTGANLEEDLFNLVAHNKYKKINWRNITAEDDLNLFKEGFNRVTDTCIPEQDAVRYIEKKISKQWLDAQKNNEQNPPHEYIFKLLESNKLNYQINENESWLLAAKEMNIPIFTPGWADSTLGNIFSSKLITGEIHNDNLITTDLKRMKDLAKWYCEQNSPIGILQVGGGIAGDFPICVVPMLKQDLGEEVNLWSWFGQISDSHASYGGYSGAPPNEKISWGKLDIDTPKFVIESDATIVLPLILTYLLN